MSLIDTTKEEVEMNACDAVAAILVSDYLYTGDRIAYLALQHYFPSIDWDKHIYNIRVRMGLPRALIPATCGGES